MRERSPKGRGTVIRIDRVPLYALVLLLCATACSGPRELTAGQSARTGGATSTRAMPTATPSPTPSPTPTPPPTPTPTPTPPPPLAHCYQPRPASLQATPAPATPGVEPPGPALALRPAGARSLFQRCQVIAYYGFPGEPVMGILGSADPDTVVRQLVAQAAEYDATNGERQVVPALHLIYAVAQGSPTEDATYLARMPDEVVQAYLAAAERHDLLVFLDIQMGHSSVAAELPHVLEYLKNPRVHLALDPEFATPGAVPGTIIGGMDAAEINAAQAMLQRLVEDAGLYNKILIVHQFDDDMIRNKPALAPYPGVDLVVDMDGFGYAAAKIGGYTRFVQEDGAPHGGFKLFYDQDVDLMTPAQVNQLVPQPDVVIYQ